LCEVRSFKTDLKWKYMYMYGMLWGSIGLKELPWKGIQPLTYRPRFLLKVIFTLYNSQFLFCQVVRLKTALR